MKQAYERATLSVIAFEEKDIITSSPAGDGSIVLPEIEFD